MKKIFVTGGAGFIGSAFVRLILDTTSDVQIINFDALKYSGLLENLSGVDSRRHEFVKGDICDREKVLDAMPTNVDAVFNFAAETHVDRSIESAEEFIRTNILGTQILLKASVEKEAKRYIQISTDEVFGSLDFDDEITFSENSPIAPKNPYAASKAAAEHFVKSAGNTYELDTIITRSGNNYGPRQHVEKLIPLTISKALNDEVVPVYGDGLNVRDWIYVEDHCRAIWRGYKEGKRGKTYNIGARNEMRNIDVVKDILDCLGKSHFLIRFVNDRAGHDKRYAIDPKKIETELNWEAKVGWEEGLQRTVESWKNKA